MGFVQVENPSRFIWKWSPGREAQTNDYLHKTIQQGAKG